MEPQQQQQVYYTTTIPASATVITVQAPPTVRNQVHHDYVLGFKREASHAMGGLMLLAAFTSFAGSTMAIFVYAANYTFYDGYWCGFFFLVAGSLALDVGRRPTKSRITSTIVFSFIALAMAGTQFGLSLAGLISNINYQPSGNFNCWWFTLCTYNYTEMEIANGLLVGAAGLQILLSIGEMIVCFHGVCSNQHVNPTEEIVRPTAVAITSPTQQQMQQPQQYYQQYPTPSTNIQYQQQLPEYTDTVKYTSSSSPVGVVE